MSITGKSRSDFSESLDLLDSRVTAVPPDRWSSDSPCEGWTAADVLAHCVANLRGLRAASSGSDFIEVSARPVEGDVASAWAEELPLARALIRSEGLDTIVLGGREVPAAGLVDGLMRDMVIHTWDIAVATGTDSTLPDGMISAATDAMAMVGPQMRRPGLYGENLTPPEGADAQTRLLALSGRQTW